MGVYSHPVSHGEAGCCHSANPSSGVVARFPRSPPIGNPIGGIRTRGPAAKRGASQGPAIRAWASRGDRASGPPVPFPIGAGWRETDHVPIGGPEKAPLWLEIEHMRTSGPTPWSPLLHRGLSTPVLPSRRAPFHLKIRRILGVKRERPAIGPARRSLIPDLAPLEGCPPAAKCAYGSFVANSPPKLGVELAHSRFPSRKWHMFRFRPSGKIAQPSIDEGWGDFPHI